MKRIFYIGAAALLVVLIGLASAPFLVPASLYKERIETAASDALGRKVTLTGEMKLSLIPRIEARAGATVIENPEGFGDAPFASMTELRAAVKLLPLLSSRVEIDEFVLVDPKINLIRLENGDANWEFGSEEAPTPEETSEGGQGGGDFAAILGDVRLVNGEITYNDYTTGASHALESLDVRVKMDALDKPLSINGDGVLDGLDFELSTRVDDTKAILDGETSPVSLDLETDLVSGEVEGEITGGDTINLDLSANVSMPSVLDAAAFFGVSDLPAATALGEVSLEGRIVGAPGDLSIEDLVFTHASDLLTTSFNGGARIADTLSFGGRVDLDAPDLKALAASADAELPEGDAYRRFAFSGDASGGATNISLTNATLTFDDIVAEGSANLSLAGTPKITGKLSTGMLDATPYAAASGAEPEETSGGWGDAALDLSPLKLADADLEIAADALKFQNWDIGQTVLLITLKDGRLVADLKRTSLYGGAGVATITADGRGATPAVGLQAELQGLDIESFLGAAANFDRIEGGGAFQINLAGEGATLDALMGSLAGAGSFDFADGAIRGVNLAQLVRSAEDALSAGALPAALSDEAETDFTDLKGNFTIANGVATTADLAMLSPFLNVQGDGVLDVGGQSLDFSLFPESTDGSFGIGGYGVPVKVAGSWNNVQASLDFDWLTSRATQVVGDQIKGEIAKELGGSLGGALGGALGLPQSSETDAESAAVADDEPKSAEEQTEDRLRNALGGLFE